MTNRKPPVTRINKYVYFSGKINIHLFFSYNGCTVLLTSGLIKLKSYIENNFFLVISKKYIYRIYNIDKIDSVRQYLCHFGGLRLHFNFTLFTKSKVQLS